ncbi:MAG: FAD/NAD(P)-binding protein [Nitrospirota bacterium]
MAHELKLVNVLSMHGGDNRRRGDLGAFECTYKAEITSIFPLSATEKLYKIRISDPDERDRFGFRPGQFIMLELPGIGEAPFSISSAHGGAVELCIRRCGNLTNFLDKVGRGATVGLRGPFGTSFPVEHMHGQNILLIAGGIGLAPLRAPISYVLENRCCFGKVDIIYGTKTAEQLIFTYEYDRWRNDEVSLHVVVEHADPSWQGPVGRTTDVLAEIIARRGGTLKDTCAIVCGPPAMFTSVCSALTKADIPMQKMFVSLERRMHCGMGKCCRCNIGSTYTCLEGPVFDYWTVMNLKEAI